MQGHMMRHDRIKNHGQRMFHNEGWIGRKQAHESFDDLLIDQWSNPGEKHIGAYFP